MDSNEAVNVLIDYQVENLITEVPYDKAIELTDSIKTDKFSNGELLFELVSYGVLAQNMRYRADKRYEKVVCLSYERFNDFLTAQRLIEKAEKAEIAVKQLINNYENLWYYAGIVESLAIILPEKEGRELFEIFTDFRTNEIIANSVLKSLLWRKTSTMGKKLVDYFKELNDSELYMNFISVLIQVSPTVGHYFNAEFMHRILMEWTMAERDSRWSVFLGSIGADGNNPVDTLITWAKEDSGRLEIDKESKYLMGIVLGWFTTSMDRKIRDNASKGLIALVRNDMDLMIKLIEKFDGVDDPYVVERIYAAAYGCALLSKPTDKLPVLAKSVYEHIFNSEGEIYPNALVRDYAKGVIEYALSIYPALQMGRMTFVPPYKSSFPDTFPSDEEIGAYSKRDKDGKLITPGISAILKSMVTEHGYTMYGDFGRYIFQYRLSGWDLNPQKLSNLAVKWIMERYGYKEEEFGKYDRAIGGGRCRQGHSGERVGKKYQWIALHEMVARLSDNFSMQNRWDERFTKYAGTWEPYIRDFDPTMLVQRKMLALYEPETQYWWNELGYNGWSDGELRWIRNDDNLPNPAQAIETVDDSGTHWIALQTMPDWIEPHGEDDTIYRNLWYQIRSYIIDEEKFPAFSLWANKQNFYGRWMPEPSNRYEMFGREYYWSSAYKYYEKDGIITHELFDKVDNVKIADVELTCINFLWESEYDFSKPDIVSYLKPSKQLFDGMDMKYSDNDGEMMDIDGKLLCFDSSVNHNCHSCLLVRKDALINYLHSNHKRIFWVLIGEKNYKGSFIRSNEWLELSGIYNLDPAGEVVGSMTAYFNGMPLTK